MKALEALWNDQEGVMSLETALVIFLVALAAVASWSHLAGSIENRVDNTNGFLDQPTRPAPSPTQ